MHQQSSKTINVILKSKDSVIQKLQSRIEKCALMHLWIAKATTLLISYASLSESIYTENDLRKRGQQMQDLESHYMSAMSFFLRCYMNQPSYHLKINDVTLDEKLRNCYKKIKNLRDDEFVHWKGLRSKLIVRYRLTFLSGTDLQFGNPLDCEYQEKIGPDEDLTSIHELFRATDKHIEKIKNNSIEQLRSRLFTPEGLKVTEILDSNGNAIIQNTNK